MEQRRHHGSKLAAVLGARAKEGNVMDWKLGGLMLVALAAGGVMPQPVAAHSGGTNSEGCHHDRQNGK